jgi:hypothetical protein
VRDPRLVPLLHFAAILLDHLLPAVAVLRRIRVVLGSMLLFKM